MPFNSVKLKHLLTENNFKLHSTIVFFQYKFIDKFTFQFMPKKQNKSRNSTSKFIGPHLSIRRFAVPHRHDFAFRPTVGTEFVKRFSVPFQCHCCRLSFRPTNGISLFLSYAVLVVPNSSGSRRHCLDNISFAVEKSVESPASSR